MSEKPHYKIFFNYSSISQYDTVFASNYIIEKDFVTFYISIPGSKFTKTTTKTFNVASYPSTIISKIKYCSNNSNLREEKLKRLLKKPSRLKRIFNKIF